MKDGFNKEYHKNGKVYSEGNYLNGLKIGEWKFYNDRGDLRYILEYKQTKHYKSKKNDDYYYTSHYKIIKQIPLP